jgi:hypothetical protein
MSQSVTMDGIDQLSGAAGPPIELSNHLDPVPTTWRSYAAELPAWGIVAGALAVSFWTQVDQVHRHGFAMWEALIWGTSTDAGTIACLFLAREGAHRGTPTWGAWLLSIACAALSVQYNVVAGVEARDWLAVEAHVWMPALALGVWFWLLHGRHRRWMVRRQTAPQINPNQPRLASPADMSSRALRSVAPDRVKDTMRDGSKDAAGSSESPQHHLKVARRPARTRPVKWPPRKVVQRLVRRRGADVTADEVMKRTGVSRRHANRLLAEERWPHVIETTPSALSTPDVDT